MKIDLASTGRGKSDGNGAAAKIAAAESNRLQFEVLSDDHAIWRLASEWTDGSDRVSACYYNQSLVWAQRAWSCISRREHYQLCVVVGRLAGKVVLIWPLVICKRFAWRQAECLGVGYEYRDILVEKSPATEQWVSSVFEFAKSTLELDLIWCPAVRRDATMYCYLVDQNEPVSTAYPTTFVQCDHFTNWSEYHKILSAKYRREQRRCHRRLSEQGNVQFQVAKTAIEIEHDLTWLFAHKHEWSKRTNTKVIWLQSRHHEEFLKSIAKDALATNELFLCTLRVDGKIIAANFGLIYANRMEMLIMSYDRAWKSYGPGTMLFEWALRSAFDQKLILVDFRFGQETFKKSYKTSEVSVSNFLMPCSRWGMVYTTWYSSKIRKQVKRFYQSLPIGLQRVLGQA